MKLFSLFIFSFFLFLFSGILAQETSLLKDKIIRLDSTKQEEFPSKIHSNQIDSLKQVWQKEEERKRTIAREKFLSSFDELPDSLTVLHMNKLDLREMPDLSRFSQLKKLHADGNKLSRIPKSAFSSDSLRFVDLSGNPIKRLKIPHTKTVVYINMEACGLDRIPRSLRKMKSLRHIYLVNNSIERTPLFLKRMDSLIEINLNYNQINLNKSAVKRLKNIKLILLAGNGLESLPENIDHLTGVRRLNLSKNLLSELPPSFSKLDSLKSVIFYENQFQYFPLEVTGIENLKELDFYYNSIVKIPLEIANLQNLERLYLSFNNIAFLPDTMRTLKNLRRLYIHHNQLVIIPIWITEIDSLEVLDVGYNRLVNFPDVSRMPNLYEVDIQDNAIGEIPWKLAKKKNLKLLFLKNNLFIEDDNKLTELKQLQKLREDDCVIVID